MDALVSLPVLVNISKTHPTISVKRVMLIVLNVQDHPILNVPAVWRISTQYQLQNAIMSVTQVSMKSHLTIPVHLAMGIVRPAMVQPIPNV